MKADKVYKKVCAYLKEAIADGNMKLGEAIYSENKLCRILNVSRTSVRRAIREMVEDNILDSRQGVGTFVKGLAAAKTICLVNYYTRTLRYAAVDSYYANFIYGAEEEARVLNSRFQIFSGVVLDENDIKSKMAHLNADGIIIDGSFQDHFKDISVFKKYYPNMVVLDGDPSCFELPSVSADLKSGFIELLGQLRRKKENILYLYDGSISRRRWGRHCLEQAAAESNLHDVEYCDYTENIPLNLVQNLDHTYLISQVLRTKLLDKHFTTIIGGSDRTALYTSTFLQYQNYNIPKDISIAGVGGVEFSAMSSPTNSTIKIDSTHLAATAVKLLHRQLMGESINNNTLVPVKFIRRESM